MPESSERQGTVGEIKGQQRTRGSEQEERKATQTFWSFQHLHSLSTLSALSIPRMNPLRRCSAGRFLISFSLFLPLVFLSCNLPTALAYENFTVGDDKGWTYPTTNVINYQSWAAHKNFTLGDYLLFNYPQKDDNVIVTYNESVYKSCDFEDSTDNDYSVWGEAGTDTFSAVPLVETGMTYFFSGANSGEHCKGGMKFGINVTQGDGLPPSLMIPPPAPADDTSNDPPADTGTTPSDATPSSPSDNSTPDSNMGVALHFVGVTRACVSLVLLSMGIFI